MRRRSQLEDIELTDPDGQPIAFTLVKKSTAVFEVRFDRLRGNGEYTLTVGPDVLDAVGNDMTRGAGGAFTGSFTISLPDLLPESTVPTLDLSHGDTVDVNWTLHKQRHAARRWRSDGAILSFAV